MFVPMMWDVSRPTRYVRDRSLAPEHLASRTGSVLFLPETDNKPVKQWAKVMLMTEIVK